MKQKVKKALSICGVDSECSDCPYNMGVSVDCIRNLVNDISEVLQEDEKKLSAFEEKINFCELCLQKHTMKRLRILDTSSLIRLRMVLSVFVTCLIWLSSGEKRQRREVLIMADSVILVLEKEFAEELFEALCEISGIDDSYELLSMDTFNVLSDLRATLSEKLIMEG